MIALVVPLSTTIGDASAAVHACGVPGVVFVIGGGYVLIRRQQSLGVQTDRRWYAPVFGMDVAAIAAGLVTTVTGAVGSLEWLLLFLLLRPMLAFILVLGSLRPDRENEAARRTKK